MSRPDTQERVASIRRRIEGAEVLVIDQSERVRLGIRELLSPEGLHVTALADPNEAWTLLDTHFFSVIVLDLDTPRPNAGLEIAKSVALASPMSTQIMLMPRRSYEGAVEAMRAGAMDVIFKSPAEVDYLRSQVLAGVHQSLAKRQARRVLTDVRELHDSFLERLMDAERSRVNQKLRSSKRTPLPEAEAFHVLVVSPSDELVKSFRELAPSEYVFESAVTGGAALDRMSSSSFQMVLVGQELPDLPTSMVLRSLSAQKQETLLMTFEGPGEGGRVDMVDTSTPIAILDEFQEPAQLIAKLEELSEAWRARGRERRTTQAFRERHGDFLRKYLDFRDRVEQALESE